MKVPRPPDTHQKVSLITKRKRKSLNIAHRAFGLFIGLTILFWVLPAYLFDGTNLKEVRLVLTRVFKSELWVRIRSFQKRNSYLKILPSRPKKAAQTQRRTGRRWTKKKNVVKWAFIPLHLNTCCRIIRHVPHSVCVCVATLLSTQAEDWNDYSRAPWCCSKKKKH